MKIFKLLIVILVVGALGYGGYNLYLERTELESNLNNVREDYNELDKENRHLQEQISHFENVENLKEEAKKNFNFKEPGEQLMIIVPDSSVSSDSDIE